MCFLLYVYHSYFLFFFKNYYSYKYHWSENRVGVLLQAAPHALHQIDPSTQRVLASYFYKDLRQLYEVGDYPGGFVLEEALYGRLHLFASESRDEILREVARNAAQHVGVALDKPKQFRFEDFPERKFGRFSADHFITSVSEFTVYKQSRRHPDPVRRILCLTETCMIERDPASYCMVSLRPLSHVAALVRHLENTQLFSIQVHNYMRATSLF